MPPIAARCGRQPPTGPSPSPAPKLTQTPPTATTTPSPHATRVRTSRSGADHESRERAVAAFSGGKMAGSCAVHAGSRHRIRPDPRRRATLCARPDLRRKRLTRPVLLSSRRWLLVCVSADCRYIACFCSSTRGVAPGQRGRMRWVKRALGRGAYAFRMRRPAPPSRHLTHTIARASPARHHLTHD